MRLRDLSFTDPRLSRRLLLGAWLAVIAAPSVALLDLLRIAGGSRYRVERGTEYDLWVRAAAVAVAAALASLLGAAFGPWWRHRRVAALLGALCTLPLAVALSLAADPRGPAPFRVRWGLVLIVAACGGVAVALEHPRAVRRHLESKARGAG
ncbi:hypothetical protein [Roseisolibacter sp. H3M3-2]|uniref:hypothetical protein n=1 Tax=Roseisolibacter sp. H3M3-2 TaxID=3031323 RepID=UPI0023D996CE|nr:hypothetical protein [Roseisolibacter sp. H3M3-2]MDF1501719.1 hypothetical protein [Roseisolibacter sp. H3M3-2]